MAFALNTSPPDAATMAIARNELRETPENVIEGMKKLKELLKGDSEIYFSEEEEYLTIFLRPCKWYADSAYQLMKRIADFKEKHKGILENLMPLDEKVAFTEENVVNVLKDLDHKGRRILTVTHGGNWDPSKVTAEQIFRMFYLLHEMAAMEPTTQINGVVAIMDYDGMGMKQVKGMGPSYALLLLTFIQEAMPLRLKEVHMVKEPMVFNMVWTLFKPFLKPKLKGRIFFHGKKMSSLHKHIPETHLPKNYGGTLPEIDYSGKEWYPVITDPKVSEHIKTMNSFGKRK